MKKAVEAGLDASQVAENPVQGGHQIIVEKRKSMKIEVNEHPMFTDYLRYGERLGLGVVLVIEEVSERLVSVDENEWENLELVDTLRVVDFRRDRYIKKQGSSLWRATDESGPARSIAPTAASMILTSCLWRMLAAMASARTAPRTMSIPKMTAYGQWETVLI